MTDDDATTIYVTGVANAVNSIQITATPTHAGAMAVIRDGNSRWRRPYCMHEVTAGAIDADGNIPLVIGYEKLHCGTGDG